MKKFLSIVWYKVLPPIYGGQKGIASFNAHLGNRVDLICLCSSDNENNDTLSYKVKPELPPSKLQFWDPFIRRRILKEIRHGKYTHIIIEHPYHAWLGKHKDDLKFTFIVHAHNIEFERMRKRGKWWWRMVRSMEATAFKHADHILFKTEEDRKFAIERFFVPNEKTILIPFGVEQRELPGDRNFFSDKIRKRHSIDQASQLILFAASFDYEPNREALAVITSEILPRLRQSGRSFRIIICGALENALPDYPEVIFAGQVPDIKEYMLAADVFINPVTKGSGIQTKNIEALSSGLTVVTTSFASKGLPVYLEGNLKRTVQDGDWDNFTREIIAVNSKPSFQDARFYKDFYWGNLVDRFLAEVSAKG